MKDIEMVMAQRRVFDLRVCVGGRISWRMEELIDYIYIYNMYIILFIF